MPAVTANISAEALTQLKLVTIQAVNFINKSIFNTMSMAKKSEIKFHPKFEKIAKTVAEPKRPKYLSYEFELTHLPSRERSWAVKLENNNF